MRYRIKNPAGDVVNTIVASEEFVQDRFPGLYEAIPDDPIPPEVPTVPMRALRKKLLQMGKLTALMTSITALAEPLKSDLLIDWETLDQVSRDEPLIAQIKTALNLKNKQIDTFFERN